MEDLDNDELDAEITRLENLIRESKARLKAAYDEYDSRNTQEAILEDLISGKLRMP